MSPGIQVVKWSKQRYRVTKEIWTGHVEWVNVSGELKR